MLVNSKQTKKKREKTSKERGFERTRTDFKRVVPNVARRTRYRCIGHTAHEQSLCLFFFSLF